MDANAPPPAEENPEQAVPVANGTQPEEKEAAPPIPESRLNTQKDISLKDFLSKMDDTAPIVSKTSSPRPIEFPLSRGRSIRCFFPGSNRLC